MSEGYSGINSIKKKDEAVSVYFNDEGCMQIVSGEMKEESLYEVRLVDLGGRICYKSRTKFNNGVLSCHVPTLSQGTYLLTINDVEQRHFNQLYSSVIFR